MKYKIRAHESFYIRKGWLYKGLKVINNSETNNIFSNNKDKYIATDTLGIGKNMVKSLRYWMQATGLTIEKSDKKNRKYQILSDIGKIIWDYDRYFEEDNTYLLLHYNLVSNQQLVTTWYILFNCFKMKEFKKEDIVIEINNYLKYFLDNKEVSQSSIQADVDCLINTYCCNKRNESYSPEDNMISPFTKFNLLDYIDTKNKILKKNSINLYDVSPYLFYYIIVNEYQKNCYKNDTNEIKIERLLIDDFNIAKVFNLELDSLNKVLDILNKIDLIKIKRTAGLNVISLNNLKDPLKILKKIYTDR